jgi:hypothetical protein
MSTTQSCRPRPFQRHAKFVADFKLFVGAKPVDAITAWPSVCWEINNSRLIQDWKRTLDLFDQAEELKLKQPWEINLLRGQFNFVVAFKQTELMTILSPCCAWTSDLGNVYVGMGACKREDLNGGGDSAKLIDRDRIRDASHHLEKALSQNPELSSVYSILGKCQFTWKSSKKRPRITSMC